MANILQQVRTYNDGALAQLQNSYAFISKSNTKFKDFDRIGPNLGNTVDFDLPPRLVTTGSLVASFQDADQRVLSLTAATEESVAIAFSAQQFIYNVREYMGKFGTAAIAELGSSIESNVASVCESAPFRFFGEVGTPISSYGQLSKALALYRNFGAPKTNTCGFLDDLTGPEVVDSGLAQFTLARNNKEAMSWEIGEFSNAEWYTSNLLPTHTSGTEGEANSVLTVVSTSVDAAGAVTSITFSGADGALDANSVKEHDSFQFEDGVIGVANLRYLTWTGHKPSQNKVQFRATSDASSTAGQEVTVSIYPALQAAPTNEQNLTSAIVPGMQCTVLASHRCGLIMAGNPLYLGMPRLPEEVPFPTAIATDPESGVSMRTYYGSKFGENKRGIIHDAIWGRTLVPEYCMKIVLPL